MHTAAIAIAVVAAAAAAAACRLDPLVDDRPTASVHVLPPNTQVPSVTENRELASQIELNDAIDDQTRRVELGVGQSGGNEVRYWSFGPAIRAAAPLYKFFERDGMNLVPIAHPPLVDALPGDRTYSPVHAIYRVIVTSDYNGELITTAEALADAIELGLVEPSAPTDVAVALVTSPIVLPITELMVSDSVAVSPQVVYGRGYQVGTFEFEPMPDVPAGFGFAPVSDISFLRQANRPDVDADRPIFQAAAPRVSTPSSSTPLGAVINVDLAPGTMVDDIQADADLYMRDAASSAIVQATSRVQQFRVTGALRLLQIQAAEGSL